MTLKKKHWESIYTYQKQEILSILTDLEFVKTISQKDHYSRIGEWAGARSKSRVLELGCGPGRYVAMLASLGCDVVGVDPVSYDTWPLIQEHKKVELLSGVFAENIPFPDNSFDGVACMGALLYFDDPDRSLSEIRRVLRPGGQLIMRTVSRGNLYKRVWRKNIDPESKHTYTLNELISLLKKHGFNSERSFSYGFFPPVLTQYWWYLVNGVISLDTQQRLSDLLPSAYRVNLVAFACRAD